MNTRQADFDIREELLVEAASHLDYPQTPDIASSVAWQLPARLERRGYTVVVKLAFGAAAALLIAAGIAMAVPQVRAAVLEFFQIGAVRIEIEEEPAHPPTPDVKAAEGTADTLADLFIETDLESAVSQTDFSIHLPGYPEDLGLPDRVFLQELADPDVQGQVLILDWLKEESPGEPGESYIRLFEIGLPFYGVKEAFRGNVIEIRVQDQPAFWVSGPHQLQVEGPEGPISVDVSRKILIWSDDIITYRLESDLSLVEARRIAESMEEYE